MQQGLVERLLTLVRAAQHQQGVMAMLQCALSSEQVTMKMHSARAGLQRAERLSQGLHLILQGLQHRMLGQLGAH